MRATRSVAVSAIITCLAGPGAGLLANCQSGQVFPITQCGDRAWFSVTPAGAGPVSGYFWQLGYGNKGRTASNPANSAINGSGFQLPLTTDGCIGNDSGALDTPQELDLVDSAFVGGPAGALCLGAGTNWINTGSDGCGDNSKAGNGGATSGTNGGSFDDNLINPAWGGGYGLGYETREYYLDAPMGVLLTEGNGRFFAAAFFASRNRGDNPNDASEGEFALGTVINGDPNPVTPGANNVIPWQAVPQPLIQFFYQDPAHPTTSPRILSIRWNPIRIIHDGSSRPSTAPSAVNRGAAGVGVMEQSGGDLNSLLRFVIETAPVQVVPGPTCGTFTAQLTVPGSEGSATLTVPPDTCVRMVTQLGLAPQQTACTLANATKGLIGDLGISVTSGITLIPGSLASDEVTITSARKNKNQTATIEFKSTSELNVTSLQLYGRTQKGQEILLATISPKQGTSGLGDSYSITLSKSQLKGARTIFVVSQPGGLKSNEFTLGR